jgi:hypothetical protein
MLRRLYHDQPATFAFTDANLAWAEAQMKSSPKAARPRRSFRSCGVRRNKKAG